jgi:putative transposase
MLSAHRIALKPNNKQATYFKKACGVARFAYNWALAEWKSQYAVHQADPALSKPNEAGLRRQLNAIKREHFPWMLEVTKNAPQMAIIQLGQAFRNFFAGRAKYPRFRKKGVDDRFTLSNDQFKVVGKRIRIPCLGWVRMRESVRFGGKVISATVSRTADRWFVSVTVDAGDLSCRSAESQGITGVDLGVSALATLADGTKKPGPRPHKSLLRRLRRLSRSLSRKLETAKVLAGVEPGEAIPKGRRIPLSQNSRKIKQRLARLHARIANIRNDALHKLTTDLTRRYNTIVIEDLNVNGMVRNRRLARSIMDMGFGEFRRQLLYKAAWRRRQVLLAGHFFPSSKACSECGGIMTDLPLSVRKWTCPECRTNHDRDHNAAKNLLAWGRAKLAGTASSAGSQACGEARLWPWLQGHGETGLDEAGSQLCSCLSRNEQV